MFILSLFIKMPNKTDFSILYHCMFYIGYLEFVNLFYNVYVPLGVKCMSCKSIKNMFRPRYKFPSENDVVVKIACLPVPLVYVFCTNLFVPNISIHSIWVKS